MNLEHQGMLLRKMLLHSKCNIFTNIRPDVSKSKIKQIPEDFLVEELTNTVPLEHGDFSLYLLEKKSITTPDAILRIQKSWKLDWRQISFGGLKDKHAVTTQFFTIKNGPQKNLDFSGIVVKYLGLISCPYDSSHITGNRFEVIIRNIKSEHAKKTEKVVNDLPSIGIPNYFDDQRFGSITSLKTEFIAKKMIIGDFEQALKMALTLPYVHDNKAAKKEKALLIQKWGDWAGLIKTLPRGHSRSIVQYLSLNPQDFKGASERLRPELGGIYVTAYQSYLWNNILARWIKFYFTEQDIFLIKLKLGSYPVVRFASNAKIKMMEEIFIPLPSSRLKMTEDDPFFKIINDVMVAEGLTLEEMKIPGTRKLFFSKGERKAFYFPTNIHYELFDDQFNKGKNAVRIGFDLPKGAYATLLVKCLQTLFWNN
ncbi:MAG: tRNA pseudouridine(13) synthase TruD [Planctomycetes bacterium]|nr:tRNA pseudouridine(13) synthase TruD [Planctomycetota bacterium]